MQKKDSFSLIDDKCAKKNIACILLLTVARDLANY